MPEWLLKSENYNPPVDKDSFLSKSILAFLKLISRIHAQSRIEEDKLLSPLLQAFIHVIVYCTRILLTALYICLYYVNLYDAGTLFPAGKGYHQGTALEPCRGTDYIHHSPALGAFWQSVQYNNDTGEGLCLSHSGEYIVGIHALGPHHRRSQAFFFPDIFIFIIDITLKYILMLGEFTLEMLYALKLRSVGKNRKKYGSLGGIAGTLLSSQRDV